MRFLKLTIYLAAFFFSPSLAFGATQVYYSVGQSAADLKTGTPTLTVSGGIATFSTEQTGNIGVGDRITYNTTEKAYISGRIYVSQWSSQWSVVTATGGVPADVTGATVNSITREYTSLVAAESGATDANHLNTADLVSGNYQLNFPCYYDSGADTTPVVVDGYTTSAENYIRIYTPSDIFTEAKRNQRHGGRWDDFKYSLVINNDHGIKAQDGHLRLEGLQVQLTNVTGNRMGVFVTSSIGAGSDIRISGNILRGAVSSGDWHMGIDVWQTSGSGVVNINNNIIYGFKRITGTNAVGIGVEDSLITSRIYNNTIYDCGLGFYRWGGTSILKNNLIQNTGSNNYNGTVDSSSTNNLSQDATAPAYGTYYRGKVVYLADAANKDIHLSSEDIFAKNLGANLSSDPNFAFSIDIDGQTRSGSWDIGADEAATAVYYSVGQNTNDHKTDSPTLSISGGIGTFSVAQTATNMGVGDKVTYNSSSVAYISQKISQTQWKLITATGGMPTDVSNQTVNSIAHAFSSLSTAATGADGASYLGTGNLYTGNYQLNFPCYYDSGPDTTAVSLDDWTTAQGNMVRIYTPTDMSREVNRSQRHGGKWDDSKYSLVISAAADYTKAIQFEEGYVWIDGLQIKMSNNDYGHAAGIEVVYRQEYNNSKVYISNNIITENHVTTNNDGFNAIQLYWAVGYVWNNLIYDTNIGGNSGNSAIMGYYNKHYVYNNTVYNSYGYGIRSNTGSVLAKNNIVQQASFSGDSFDAASGNNISDNATAPGSNSKINTTVSFANAANKDFHLSPSDTAARNAGANLQADPYLAFERDIDSQARDGSWDIGADEFVATLAQSQESADPVSHQGGLLGHWTLDGADISGNMALDKSGNGRKGSITGARAVLGKLGQGMSFDGVDDHLSFGVAKMLDGYAAAGICFWMKYLPAAVSADGAVISAYTPANPGFMVWVDDVGGTTGRQNTLSFVFRSGIDFQLEGSDNLITSGQWDHYCVSYQGGSYARIYKNGVLDRERTDNVPASITDSLNELEIGWQAGGRILNAELDDLRVYGKALSEAEVGVLYKSGQTQLQSVQKGNAQSLWGYWTFENADMSGGVISDKSGNGNSGTISGAAPALGKLGQGLSFDGVDDYVSIPNPTISFPKSVSYWVRPTTLADGVNFGLYLPGGEWMAGGFYGGKFLTDVYDVGAPGSAFSVNEWNHVVVVQQDFETISVYVNGSLVTIAGTGDSFGPGGESSLGRRMGGPYSARFFAGGLDDFRIYDRLLTGAEIVGLYKTGIAEIRK